jgi:hypothetical protein
MLGELTHTFLLRLDQFDEAGTYTPNGKFLLEIIQEWEKEFYNTHAPFMANHIFAMQKTLNLLQRCIDPAYDYGMDANLDLDSNLEMEPFLKKPRIYAIGSELTGNEEEPIFLMVDDSISEGAFTFKYIPEEDGDEEADNPPAESPERERVLV